MPFPRGVYLTFESALSWLEASGCSHHMAMTMLDEAPILSTVGGAQGRLPVYPERQVRYLMLSRGVQPGRLEPHLSRFQLQRRRLVPIRRYDSSRRRRGGQPG